MAYQMGVVTPQAPTDTQVELDWTAASGGTGPYSYKVYRSIVNGFTPGVGNLITTLGVGVLSFIDTGLIPNTQYYYVVQSVDTGNANATANSAQASVLTNPQDVSMNQFQMTPFIGTLDQQYNFNTLAVIIDPNLNPATKVYPGQAMKFVNPSLPGNQVNYVTPCTAANDPVAGFMTYSIKDAFWTAGMQAAMSQSQNVQYLFATSNGNVGDYGELDLSTVGGVKVGTPSDGNTVVVQFQDQPVAGVLVRCKIRTPTRETF